MMNHTEALDAAYKALAMLRKQGRTTIQLLEIAKKSGVSRAAIYLKHPDWNEFRDVAQNNKPSQRVKLASVEIDAQQGQVNNLHHFETRLANYEKGLCEMRTLMDTIYTKLVAQVHKFAAIAKETPREREKNAKRLSELAEVRNLADKYKTQCEQLTAEKALPVDIRPLAKKERIPVFEGISRDELAERDLYGVWVDAINSLDDYFIAKDGLRMPSVVFVACGNFAAGKATWIENHKPLYPGINLYVDGNAHSQAIRTLIVKRIRKLSQSCKIICVTRRASGDEAQVRNSRREQMDMEVSKALVEDVSEIFELVTIDEGFDAIEIVR